ncbi:peptidase C19, ubiquitin carboxyl-terminal hydrolase 2 [Obba rivulosa]|uniref:ubiquitinyl hydrolase 1 n=1 Tax=Obba rivulosa TaxID=1052685 RepID=A0A8E2DQI8_9APHY|nr:peptidase C19, ubiquitin carboxyl-terminal hydrolase 2 [Obba rivulosa]
MLKYKKNPTPQELYRARKQREEEEKDAHLPPGLINHGNTCFMNSTLQGLMATELLHNLVNFEPVPPTLQNSTGLSVVARRSPQLTNGHGLGGPSERAWVEGMPLGDVFIQIMRKAWDIQESRRRESMSPKDVLLAIGRKYDQYLGFRQQDAHEFLRHMLDAMRMEELDIIKQRQPPPPKETRKRSRRKPVPSTSIPGSLDSSTHASTSSLAFAPASSGPSPPSPDEKLESFVDMLFGGRLASILVCEKCKKVSLTYEDFNDLSLSIKPEDYGKGRKRDRLRMFARRLRFRPAGHRASSVPAAVRRSTEDAAREEEPPVLEDPRRRSFDGASAEMDEARDEVREMAGEGVAVPESGSAVEEDEEESEESEGDTREGRSGPAPSGKGGKREREDGEQEKEKKDKDKDDPWGKLGRRLSMSVKMGWMDKEMRRLSRSHERERGRQRDVKGDGAQTPNGDAADSRTSPAASKQAAESTSFAGEANDERTRNASASPAPVSPTSTPTTAVPPAMRLPNIRRSSGSPFIHMRHSQHGHKSPGAPKQSAEEAAYLRRLLADIHPSNSNPLSVLQSAFAGGAINGSGGSPTPVTAQAIWTKMGHLPGIEECLRMFTAVEILDGENMVGCHRCWKIANGLYKPKRPEREEEDDDDAESESDESEDSPARAGQDAEFQGQTSSGSDAPLSSPDDSLRGRISPASAPAVDMTASVSSDYFYDTQSVSSAPTTSTSPEHSSTLPKRKRKPPHLQPPAPSPDRPTTYGGLPIPSISTTAPESPISPPAHLTEAPAPTDTHADAAAGLGVSPSDDSLLTPRAPPAHARRRKGHAEEEAEDSSSSSDESLAGSESSASANTSFSDASSIASPAASPTVSPRASVERLRSAAPSQQSTRGPRRRVAGTKVPKAQQVVLRRTYKRYLIAVPPPVLVVHLKRFQQVSRGHSVTFSGGFKKLDDFVAFPEYLDLAPFLAPRREEFGLGHGAKDDKARKKEKEETEPCMYRLYAVVVHIGNMLGGHYVAYTALPPSHPPPEPSSSGSTGQDEPPASPKLSLQQSKEGAEQKSKRPQRQWAYISDTVVRLTTIEEVLKAKAYICMYERI